MDGKKRPLTTSRAAAARYLLRRGWRVLISAVVVILLIAAGVRLRDVNTTTVALGLVLVILGIGVKWGALEAVVGAVVAGFGLDYFLLPPDGFGIAAPEHWVALLAFLVTALVTSQLSARANRNLSEAIERREEIERLYQVADAISEGENADEIVQGLGRLLTETFGLESVAVYQKSTGCVFRFGILGEPDGDERLREAARREMAFVNPESGGSTAPVLASGEVWGSIGITGTGVSSLLLKAIAERVGTALGRSQVAEGEKELAVARRSEEMKAAILDALAHEANCPLGSIKIAATTLRSERPGSPAQQRELLALIEEEADRLSRWIDEAKELRRADARQLEPHKAPQDLRDLVSGAIEERAPLMGGRRIRVRFEESLPLAYCDGGMIQRVLSLLLDNALKYSSSGSTITVTASVDNEVGMILVGVADAGPGVPEEEKACIFEKHYRGSQHSASVPGTGLGLASAKCLVEAHGGEIWVTNRPGGGAVFQFSLPVAIESMA